MKPRHSCMSVNSWNVFDSQRDRFSEETKRDCASQRQPMYHHLSDIRI